MTLRLPAAASVVLALLVPAAPPALGDTPAQGPPTAPYLALTADRDLLSLVAARPHQEVRVVRPAPHDPGDVGLGTDVPGLPFVTVRAPFVAPLVEGVTYPTSSRATDVSPGLDPGCPDPQGELEVLEVEQDSGRIIRRLAATYRYRCSDGQPEVRGEIRLEASTGFRAAQANPSPPDLGVVRRDAGREVTVTVASTGSDAVTLGRARGTGPAAGDLRVVEDGCAGKALPAGATCDVRVLVAPAERGRQTALLEVPDDTAAGRRLVRLAYEGADLPGPPTSVQGVSGPRRTGVSWAEPADSGGQRVEDYRIFTSRDGGPFVGESTGIGFPGAPFDEAQRGESVRYAVAAVTRAGEGPRSEVVTAQAPDLEVVYETGGRLANTVHLVDPDGDARGRGAQPTGEGFEPELSPDGNRLAFVQGGQVRLTDRVPALTSRALTQDAGYDAPAWTPDGRSLVVGRFSAGRRDLVVLDAAAAPAPPRAVPDGDSATDPSVSPAGTHVVFRDLRPGTGGLAVMRLDGGGRRVLPGTEFGNEPVWSPDGQSIVFWRSVARTTNADGATRERIQLLAVPPTGGQPRVLADLPGAATDPAVSFDSSTVFFAYLAPDASFGYTRLWSVPLDGSAPPRERLSPTNSTNAPSVVGPGPVPLRDRTAPDAPAETRREVGADRATLTLSAPADSDVVELVVRRSAPDGPAPATPQEGVDVPVTDGAAALTGLEAGRAYAVSLFAVDASGNVGRATTSVTTTGTASPPAPEPSPEPAPAPEPSPAPTGSPSRPGAPAPRAVDDSCPPGRVPDAGFDDVDPSSTHADAIDCVTWWQVASGTGSGRYTPAAAVSREQMATFIARTVERSGGSLPAPTRDWFPDDDGSRHEASINRLAEAGIVAGRADGGYGPALPVSRAQMAKFLVLAHAHRTGRTIEPQADYFSDDDGSVHEGSIDRAAEAGFTGGSAGGGYRPEALVTREQMASFLSRVLDLLVEQGAGSPPG